MSDTSARARRARASIALLAITLLPLAARPPVDPARDGITVVTGRVTDQGGQPLASAMLSVDGRSRSATTGADGHYALSLTRTHAGDMVTLRARRVGYDLATATIALRADSIRVDFQLVPSTMRLGATVVTGAAADKESRSHRERSTDVASAVPTPPSVARTTGVARGPIAQRQSNIMRRDADVHRPRYPRDSGNTEAYDPIDENPFRSPRVAALSTFSVDVDRASYANVRRFLTRGSLPPRDAVRIEELVNYFPYSDPVPSPGEAPLRISTEVTAAPWNGNHDLVRIALRARDVDMRRAPANNLVFLVDVSGSMSGPLRLPLVKQSLALLVNELREQDRVAIVVYAGQAGLVLPSTAGSEKQRILSALDALEAGGSTAGGAGIRLAYDVAKQNFISGGNNRVILCTDGDFNVGQSSDGELVHLIEDRRRDGAFLTILGYGMGNYKDAKMEKLAGAGNGNYGYIDDLLEARKLLVTEMGGTLLTVAKDVKLQVEFNPARVYAYRLLGYEDRLLRDEDFANDARDAGDVGAGHTVTALYEIVPVGAPQDVKLPPSPELRYQRDGDRGASGRGDELLHVAMRYKTPDGERSQLVRHAVSAARARPSESMRFASAVAGFGMLLRGSPHAGSLTWSQVISLARGARGRDEEGYRADFIGLTERAAALSHNREVGQLRER